MAATAMEAMKRTKIVARCGDSSEAPENTLAAFSKAISKGAQAIELDVHMTRDGQLVVHHDFYLGRTNNGSGLIGDCTLAELKALDAGSWFRAEYAGETIPTLAEALELGRGKIRYEIDMKDASSAFLDRLVAEVARLDMLDQIELTSAHIPLLFQVKQVNSRIRTGMFFYPLPQWMELALGQKHVLDWLILSKFEVAHLHASLMDRGFVERLWENCFLVHGSNLNTDEEIELGITLSIDQFSTDRLAYALKKVGGRAKETSSGQERC